MSTAESPAIIKPSLLQQLEDEILDGSLKPGDHLREVALAKRLGVSRTPLRQALTRLEEMGWVKIIPKVGAFVREISLSEAADLFLVRKPLEGLAAERVCRRWTPALKDQLTQVADQYKDHRLNNQYYETRVANCSFHRLIVDAADCQVLSETITRMRLILRCEMARHPFENQLGVTPPQRAVTHYDIIDALSSGDPAHARAAAEQHLEQVRARMTDLLQG